MKKAFLTTAVIAALGVAATSASAQGIQPVTTAPETDVTVGTQVGTATLPLIIAGITTAVILGAASTADGTTSGTN